MKSRRIIISIIVLCIAWLLRPWLHPLLMAVVIAPLKFILLLGLIVMIVSIIRRVGPIRTVRRSAANYTLEATKPLSAAKTVSALVLFAVIIVGLGIEDQLRIARTAATIDYQERTTLPEFTPLRLTPKQVAERYAHDTFQSPQERLGDSQIALIDNRLQRVFPRLPDGALLYFIRPLTGFVTVATDTLDRTVNISDQEFRYAEGIGVFDNLYYRLSLKRYFVTYSSEPTYLKDDQGEWITVVPFITYKGFFLPVPTWGGVMVVHSDGTIDEYTPDEAVQISYLAGNRLYPKELASYYARSYAYSDGLINNWFIHRDQSEVVQLPNDETVIHAPTTEGFKQIVVAEPYGRSYGIYKIFLFDATTGKREIISYTNDTQLTGPVAAADYVKKEFPTYDWTAFSLSEPRPLLINNELHWLMSIIPNDAAGIAATIFVNAQTNAISKVTTPAELQALLTRGIVQDDQPVDTNATLLDHINTMQQELDSLRELLQ